MPKDTSAQEASKSSKSSIRLATKEDFNLISEFTQCLIEESSFGALFKGYQLTELMLDQYISAPYEKLCLIIGEDEGFAMFDTMSWPYIDHAVKFAKLSFVYIRPESRKSGLMDNVLTALEYWAKQTGCNGCLVGPKTKKKGYKKVETVYMKVIN